MRRITRIGWATALTAALALLSACGSSSTSEPSGSSPSTAVPGKPAAVAFVTTWGTGPSQLAHELREEGTAEGPNSFVVDELGQVHVLDQLQSRIQVFAKGKVVKTVPLPDQRWDDLDVDGDGYVLLDRHERQAVVFLDAQGTETARVALADAGLDEPELITAVEAHEDGVWVELEGSSSIHLTDAQRAPLTEPEAYGGVLSRHGDKVLLTRFDEVEGSIELFTQPRGGELVELGKPALEGRVAERLALDELADGRIALVVALERAGADGELRTGRQAVIISADGKAELWAFPASLGAEDQLRSARVGRDGKLYAMSFGESGVTVAEVKP